MSGGSLVVFLPSSPSPGLVCEDPKTSDFDDCFLGPRGERREKVIITSPVVWEIACWATMLCKSGSREEVKGRPREGGGRPPSIHQFLNGSRVLKRKLLGREEEKICICSLMKEEEGGRKDSRKRTFFPSLLLLL